MKQQKSDTQEIFNLINMIVEDINGQQSVEKGVKQAQTVNLFNDIIKSIVKDKASSEEDAIAQRLGKTLNKECVNKEHKKITRSANSHIEDEIIPLTILLNESEDSLVAKFCCAGLSKKDVNIASVDDKVSVSKNGDEKAFEFKPFHGNFVKESIKAKMERGILSITIEKTPANKPVAIKIS